MTEAWRASMGELLAEVIDTRRDITDAKAAGMGVLSNPRYENTYQIELARLDRMIERARAVLASRTVDP